MDLNPSFREKSCWIQLAGLLVLGGAYIPTAAIMATRGIGDLTAYALPLGAATVLMIAVTVAGFILAATTSQAGTTDERDKRIHERAVARSAWVLSAGAAIGAVALTVGLPTLAVAHGLLAALFMMEVLRNVLQLLAYRRGF